MRLRRNEYRPIHKSISCCGREQTLYARRLQLGIRRIEDPHHPRGRELRSRAEMRKLLNRKIVEQDKKCAICHVEFTDYNDIVPDHTDPKGMGGGWRDDHPENTFQVICATRFSHFVHPAKQISRSDLRFLKRLIADIFANAGIGDGAAVV